MQANCIISAGMVPAASPISAPLNAPRYGYKFLSAMKPNASAGKPTRNTST